MVEQTNSTLGPAVPTFDKLMAPALRALKAMGGSASNEEMLGKIIELEHIPQDVQAVHLSATGGGKNTIVNGSVGNV